MSILWTFLVLAGTRVIVQGDTCADLDPHGCANNMQLCTDHVVALYTCPESCGLCPTSTRTTGTTQKIDGGWSNWSDYSACSRTCGQGATRERYRDCSNPSPANGGQQCSGSRYQINTCPYSDCEDGHWSLWSTWSDCAGRCDNSTKHRLRNCVISINNGTCFGSNVDWANCNENCPTAYWLDWSAWSACSHTCDSSVRFRQRQCYRSDNHVNCPGDNLEHDTCFINTNCSGGGVQNPAPIDPTNPASTITTGSADCRQDWVKYGTKCYYFSTNKSTWGYSRDYCLGFKNSSLVSITNQQQNDWIIDKFREHTDIGDMWIGAFKTEKESYFEWTTNGLRVDFSDWAPGEPALHFADNCVSIDQNKGYKWASFSCSSRFNWICEQRLEISHPNIVG